METKNLIEGCYRRLKQMDRLFCVYDFLYMVKITVLKLFFRVYAILKRVPANYLKECNKQIVKFLWRNREPRIAKAILKSMVMVPVLSNKKGTEDWNRHVSKENIRVTNKHMKDLSSTSLWGNVNQNRSEVLLHTH